MNEQERRGCAAVAHLYHTLFTGLILTVVTRRGEADAARWMHGLFRAQHHAKFLSSFDKLGLSDMPPAVACAAYHSLSNGIGGVTVEFMRESDTKAWVRFPPPRWVYPGAAICGIPSSVSRGMLTGWYAQNGISLGVPGLRFVCTGQTVDCQPGLMGYFEDTGRTLADDERLSFSPGEIPPPYDPAKAPVPPAADWPEERLVKANRNYAMEYLRTGLPLLFQMFGVADALHLGRTACWLVGAQLATETAGHLGVAGREPADIARILADLSAGEGTPAEICDVDGQVAVRMAESRVFRDLPQQPDALYEAHDALAHGLVAGLNRFARLQTRRQDGLRLSIVSK